MSGRVCSTAACAVPGRFCSIAPFAASGRVCSTAACAASGRVCSTAACAASGRVCSATGSAASGRVYSTAACAASGRVCSATGSAVPGRVCSTAVCAAPARVCSTAAFAVPGVSGLQQVNSICCIWLCLSKRDCTFTSLYKILCCTWTCLFIGASTAPGGAWSTRDINILKTGLFVCFRCSGTGSNFRLFSVTVRLKGQCHEIFASGFFHESVSPKPLSIPVGPFRIFKKIRGDIRSSRLTTGINDTGGKQWD